MGEFEVLVDGTIAKNTTTNSGIVREMFTPNMEISGLPEDIAEIAKTAWTKEIVSEYVKKCNFSPLARFGGTF